MGWKGFAEPVVVWRLAGLGQRDPAQFLTPFVGRGAELAQIVALLDSCLAAGSGGIVYVRGEPGIGKSRLAQEARLQATRRVIPCHVCHWFDFVCGDERDPLRRLADSLLGLMPGFMPYARSAAVLSFIGGRARRRAIAALPA